MTTPEQLKEEFIKWVIERKQYNSTDDYADFWLNKIQSLLGEIEGRIEHSFYGANDPKIKDVLSIIQEYKGKKI